LPQIGNGADGISDIEGKATRVGASECGQRTSFNGADGISDIEGKVARAATSKLGNERVSITNPVPNPGIISGRCLQCGLLAMDLMGSATRLR
jgi:hypothetical protein